MLSREPVGILVIIHKDSSSGSERSRTSEGAHPRKISSTSSAIGQKIITRTTVRRCERTARQELGRRPAQGSFREAEGRQEAHEAVCLEIPQEAFLRCQVA